MRQADAGLLEPFIEYIADNLNTSLEIMIKGAKGESIEEPDDLEKEIALLEQKLKGVAQTIEVSRSGDVPHKFIRFIYHSIDKTVYKKKGNLLEKFYNKSHFSLAVDGTIHYRPNEDAIEISRRKNS